MKTKPANLYGGKYKKIWDDKFKSFNMLTLNELEKLTGVKKAAIKVTIKRREGFNQMEFSRKYKTDETEAQEPLQMEIYKIT